MSAEESWGNRMARLNICTKIIRRYWLKATNCPTAAGSSMAAGPPTQSASAVEIPMTPNMLGKIQYWVLIGFSAALR